MTIRYRIAQLKRGYNLAVARRQQRQFQRSKPANRAWTGLAPAAIQNIPAASKVLFATFVLANQGIDETVLRIVGGLAVSSDQQSASEFQMGAAGMCLVTDTALAAGIASIPDPVTDVQDDIWIWYQSFGQRSRFSSAVGVDYQGSSWYPFDNRAKRIISTGQSIAVVVANAHATHAFDISINLRLLSMVRGT